MKYATLLELVAGDSVFESSMLLAGNVDPDVVRMQLSRWVRAQKIYQLRRGLYAIAPPYQKQQPHPFLVANRLQRASYVSLQSALSFYGLIPDVVNSTTNVSTGRPESVDTPLGNFQYRHIKTELLFGYQLMDLGRQTALIATPEKALLDLIYLQPGGSELDYLKELRLQHTEILDRELLIRQAGVFNTQKLRLAARRLLQVIFGETEGYEVL
jgi:predicted transcriptional regulator of viral defense system